MWNKRKNPKQPKKRSLTKKIVLMSLLTIVVLGIVGVTVFWDELGMDEKLLRLKYWRADGDDTYGTYSFDSHNSNCYAGFDDGLAVASVGGLSTYSSDGEPVFVSQTHLSLPQIKAAGDTVMTYDVGGTSLVAIHSEDGEVLRVDSEKAILDADLSEDGDICYLTSEGGYKSVLAVYNEDHELIYRWLSASTYMPLCAISEEGDKVATVGLEQKNGSFVSVLNYFRTDSEEIEKTIQLGGDLIYDLVYEEDDVLCVIGETGVTYLSSKGEVLKNYPFGRNYLKDYNDSGDGFLALSLNSYRAGNRFSLVVIDEEMEDGISVYVGQEILDLSAAGDYIAVLTPREMTVYDRDLSARFRTQDVAAATAVVMRPDGTALLLGDGVGRLFIP